MGDSPLEHWPRIDHLKEYLRNQNILTLWDISEWNTNNSKSQKGWLIYCPPHLNEKNVSLISKLQGKSQISNNDKDTRERGRISGIYTTSAGYRLNKNLQPLTIQLFGKASVI